MITANQIEEFEQDPADVADYSVDFTAECVRYRAPDSTYAQNVCVRPARGTGLQYRATTAGRSGSDEPRWPLTAGQTVQDGSVVWTAEAAGAASLFRQLQGVVWTADAGITVGSPTMDADACVATANVSGGVHGQSYLVRAAATFTDNRVKNRCFTVVVTRPSKASA